MSSFQLIIISIIALFCVLEHVTFAGTKINLGHQKGEEQGLLRGRWYNLLQLHFVISFKIYWLYSITF